MTRTPPMRDAVLIAAMNNATSLELYQLAAMLERLMSEPRRIVEIRKRLHLGQVVRFYDARRDRMVRGRIVQLRDAGLTLQGVDLNDVDVGMRIEWKLPYAAVEPPLPGEQPAAEPLPAAPRPTRDDFARGDKVSFVDRHLQTRFGVVTRCNPKRAGVACEDGTEWGVPYAMLRHVVEI